MRENDRYVNVPCELFRGFASSPEKRRECINNVLNYALFVAYRECGSMDGAYKYLHIHPNVGKDETKEEVQERSITHGKKIAESIKGKCKFYISVDELFEFRDEVKPYNICVQFLGYHALKSIQGKARYFHSTNGLWLARMDGQDKPDYDPDYILNENGVELEIKNFSRLVIYCPVLRRFATKYKLSQLREVLHEYRKVSFYIPKNVSRKGTLYSSHGFFFSTKMTQEELISEVEFNSTAKRLKKKGGIQSETEQILKKLKIEKEAGNENKS